MNKKLCLLIVLLCGWETVKAALLENYTGLSYSIVMDYNRYKQCFNQNGKEVPENFSDFLDQFTCRKTRDPIEHCLCLNRIIKELTPEDKKNLEDTLKRTITFDPKADAFMTVENSNFTLLAGIYKDINSSANVAPLSTCENSVKELEKLNCSNTANRFKNIFSLQSLIINNKSGLNNSPKEEQIKLMHSLYKTIIKNNIDVEKIGSLKEIYDLAAKEDPKIPELSRLSSNFERYFVSSKEVNDSVKRNRLIRFLKTLKENRTMIADMGKALSDKIRPYVGDVITDMADENGESIFKKTMSVYAESELKYYCENYFQKNGLYYCQQEKERYNNVMKSLDLNVDQYAQILKDGKNQNNGNKESVALIGLEGLYCSKLSDKIKENKDSVFGKELPKNCDSSLCKLIYQRMQNGITLDKVQEELGLISNMPKTHDFKIGQVAKDEEKATAPAAPVSSNEGDMHRKNTPLNVEEVFTAKLGINKEKVSTAFNEVKKSHPELNLEGGQKPQVHSQDPAIKEAAHPESIGPHLQPQPTQNFQVATDRPNRSQNDETQSTQAFSEKSYSSSFVQPRANSTINMFPPEADKFKMQEIRSSEVKVKSTPKSSSGDTEVSQDLAKLKEEYSKLKSEMASSENMVPQEAPVARNEALMNEHKIIAPVRSEGHSSKAQVQNTYAPQMEMPVPNTAGSSIASAGQGPQERALPSKAAMRTAGNSPQENHSTGLFLTNQSVYTISADEVEMIKKDPQLLHSKFKNGTLDPEIFTVSDASGEVKYLKAIYALNDKNEKSFVEFKEVEKSELCKANIIHGNCEVPMAKTKMPDKKGKTARRHQMYKVKDLEKIIEKSTQNPNGLESRGDKT